MFSTGHFLESPTPQCHHSQHCEAPTSQAPKVPNCRASQPAQSTRCRCWLPIETDSIDYIDSRKAHLRDSWRIADVVMACSLSAVGRSLEFPLAGSQYLGLSSTRLLLLFSTYRILVEVPKPLTPMPWNTIHMRKNHFSWDKTRNPAKARSANFCRHKGCFDSASPPRNPVASPTAESAQSTVMFFWVSCSQKKCHCPLRDWEKLRQVDRSTGQCEALNLFLQELATHRLTKRYV